jgi:succinate dehydrogenase/fumarate reductase flavoprotein subunit
LNLKERPRNVWAITDADGAADLHWTAEMFEQANPLTAMALDPECLAVADTLAELAEKTGLPEEALTATIEKYNGFADAGEDADFGKPMPLYKLATPPFFAAQLCLIRHTQVGGVRINTKTQVLDRADTLGPARPIDQMKTIPHLYATGEVAGGSLGWRRVHNKIGHYISFARISGRNAAAEESLA